ncbi:MAG TPA: UbiA prenyltransferase family protein [Polyangiales bacterium]|nr:UbiA prenyltransferase family protein [Polyangiales bacterium]
MVRDYLELSRPKDWVKNVFVFMPVPFALASGASLDLRVFALGLIGFCCANSAVYSFNDALDAERDRAHEKKKNRPIASGRITKRSAYFFSASLATAAITLAVFSGRISAPIIVATYLGINLAYCLGAKHVPLLDVFLLSSGFMLRVLLGCALLDVPPSNPMLLCSWALALFIALAKRRSDVLKGLDESHRPSLLGYNQAFLDHAMGITASMAVVGYALYSMESSVLLPSRKFASLPFVMFGVLDYLRLAHVNKRGGSPQDVLLGSPALILTGIGWLLAVIWSVHLI